MAFQKKVMILTDVSTLSGNGVVKLTADGGETRAEVTVHGDYKGKETLLLRGKSGLFAYPLSAKCTLDLSGFDITENVDCLVINKVGKAVLFGTTGGDKYRCFNLADEYVRQKSKAQNAETCCDSQETFRNSPPEEIVEKPEEDDDEQDVPDYDEGFTVNSASVGSAPVFGAEISYDGDNFYLAVKPQLDEMFTCYPVDNQLIGIVPSSNWVRVKTADDYYVVGLISDLDEPKYICYGIHGSFNTKPPDEIKNVCDWLPIDLNMPEGEGYWMIYQDCKTGKTVEKK